MEFRFESLRLHKDTDERIDVATRVEFDDTAELLFAVSCVEAVIQFLQHEDVDADPENIDVLMESYEKAVDRLKSLAETGITLNQNLIPQGVVSQNRFGAEGQEVANAVYLCVNTIRNNHDVRTYFPAEQADLLTVFASAE